jgi:hypothetical protein
VTRAPSAPLAVVSLESPAPSKPPGRLRFARDLVGFVFSGKRAWLVPILLVLAVVSLLAAVGALTPYAAFLYPL